MSAPSRLYSAVDAAREGGGASVALVCVIVTYNPAPDVVARELAALPTGSAVVIVDNASSADAVDALAVIVQARQRAFLQRNSRNIGLAAAVNQGVKVAHNAWPTARFLLLLDQDSEPVPDSVELLMEAHERLSAAGEAVGAVGPALLDVHTGLRHGFHQRGLWTWRRVHPDPQTNQPVACANLNGSGTLMRMSLFLELGGLAEAFFIDHVDTEWAFRLTAAGYGLWGIPKATFMHRMGEHSMRIWFFGWRVWPSRTPQRHYFLFRNAILLLRTEHVPGIWKNWAVVKLLFTACLHGVCDSRRFEQWRFMLRGVLDGIRYRDCQP